MERVKRVIPTKNLVDPEGLIADGIYVSEKKDKSLYQSAINMKSYKNIFTVVTHGYGGIVVKGHEVIDDEIAESARKSGKSEILLIACYQGSGEFGNSAQKIANKSGLPVQYTGGSVVFILGKPISLPNLEGVGSFGGFGWHYAYPEKRKNASH